MRKSTFIIILALVLLIIGIFFGYYFFFLNKPAGDAGTESQNGFPNIGGNLGDGTGTQNDETGFGGTGVNQGEAVVPRLRQISDVPTAGMAFKEVSSAREKIPSYIRWIERATGHVYETRTDTLNKRRISNTTIPKIYEAVGVDNGGGFVLRYLKDDDSIQSYYIKLPETATSSLTQGVEKPVEGTFLQKNILGLAVSPATNRLFSLIKNENSSSGIVSETNGAKRVSVWSSPAVEWLVNWPEEKTIILNTKPSASTPGFAYTLNPQTFELREIIGNIEGLKTLLSPDKSCLFYSGNNGNSPYLRILDAKTHQSENLSLVTLPEKCAWSTLSKGLLYCAIPKTIPAGLYPDSWYEGSLSFDDELWSIDVVTGTTKVVLSKNEIPRGSSFDITNPVLNKDETYLLFNNKNDLTLWGLRLK